NNYGSLARRAQGYMEHGPVFGAVDLLALKHGVDPLPQAGFIRELQEQIYRLARDAIFRVIEINARHFGGQALATPPVIRKQVSQMQLAGRPTVDFEALPGGP